MTSISRTSLVLLVLAGALACDPYARGNRRIADPETVSRIQLHKTTKAEVEAMFGKPKSVTLKADGVETWEYNFQHTQSGFFAAKSELKTIGVTFDRNGVVREVSDKRTVGAASLFGGVHTETIGE